MEEIRIPGLHGEHHCLTSSNYSWHLKTNAAGGLIWPIQNDVKTCKMIETLAHGYSSESTQREPFNEYQHDRF